MKPVLSICIIIKDEEKVLARCLESIYGIADEIIVVDTGSQDESKDIALSYTDKVYDFEWINDFSKARNFAASKATGKWIFVIDADEYVDRDDFVKFRNELLVNPPEHNIIGIQIVSFVGENGNSTSLNYHERLYKNDGTIFYYRNVHELLVHKNSKENKGFLNLQLYHSGYMKETMNEKKKFERNLTLLLNKDEKEPIDYFFIGNEYRNIGEIDKAINYYQKGYKLKESIYSDWVKKLLLYLIDSLHVVKRDDEAMEILDSCEDIYPSLVDFKFFRAVIYYDKKQYKQSKNIFKYILSLKQDLVSESSIDFLELLPLKYLGEIYEIENDLYNSVECYSKALSINEADDGLWVKLITLLAKHSTLEELAGFLNDTVVTKKSMTPKRVVKILLDVQHIDVQRLSRSLLDEAEFSSAENEAVLLKNLFLDECIDEVMEMLNKKTSNEIVALLSTGIFSIIDFILLSLKTNDSRCKKVLLDIKYDQSLENLYYMLFNKKNKKLSVLEENFFISLYKQASVLKASDVLKTLYSKKSFLSKHVKQKINELREKES